MKAILVALLLVSSTSVKANSENESGIHKTEAMFTQEVDQDMPETTPEKENTPPYEGESDAALSTVEIEKPEAEVVPDMNCSDMFAEWIRRQPKKNQEKHLEGYFYSALGNEFAQARNNEFTWREKEDEYKKNFSELISKDAGPFKLWADVELGKYDFKKKRFPIKITTSTDGSLGNFFDGGTTMYSSVLGTHSYAGSMTCQGIQQEPNYPVSLSISIANQKADKFLFVTEEQGKEIAEYLGTRRKVNSSFEVIVTDLKTKPSMFNKKQQIFIVSTKLKKAVIHLGIQQYEYSF